MVQDFIKIRGARVHNLKNVDIDIPKNKLVVITGLSGSGKSSLAFDTLYAEGQRRYVESLSAYARQFLGVMDKPDVDKIEGISPAISIDQRKASHNPRSTVGTMTEIYDYLRLLFARVGQPHCPKCGKAILSQTIDQITEQVLKLPSHAEIIVLGPVIRGKKGEHGGVLEEIKRGGFIRVRIDGIVYLLEEAIVKTLDKNKKHNIEVVVDRLILDKDLDKSRLVDSLETALKLGKGIVIVQNVLNVKNVQIEQGRRPIEQAKRSNILDIVFSEHFACETCGISLSELEPRLFSFNSPYGACPACQGLGEKLEVDRKLVLANPNLIYKYGQINIEGVISYLERRYHETDSDFAREEIEQYMIERKCEKCQGKKLRPEVLAITVADKSIDQIVEMPIEKVEKFFAEKINSAQKELNSFKIAIPIVKEIINRLQFLLDVGLNYLTLDRRTDTLAGGEEQRIRLATQIGSKLTGVLYILDEPSIGLHARDQGRLIETLKKLRDLGNSVIITEHDPQTIQQADWVIDVGPGAGKNGGRIIFEGTPNQLLKSKTLTGEYLSGRKTVEVRLQQRSSVEVGLQQRQQYLTIKGAKEHNLKNIDVKIPLGKFVCITGVSGSGKSSLMNDILARALLKKFYRAKEEPGIHGAILGAEFLNKVVLVDQSPIGRTPRSNPATYTGAFAHIRDIFTKTKEARIRGYQAGRFSFNVKGGRCEACEGQGVKKIEMYFLPDVYVECEECKGKRFNKETLAIEYRGKNIAQVLEMTVEEASEFFKNIPGLYQKLKTLNEVGLGYVQIGQPAPSLSGGEAQRVKLATELAKRATGKTLYILDEPTTGLHMDDIKKLILVLKSLASRGNTVLVTEHNLSVICSSDYVIDLGLEGGEGGGQIVAEGTPREISKNRRSYTGKYLREIFSGKVL